jgi:hypothetical protein
MPFGENANVPSTWYKYDFPLTEVENAPVPSNADYSPQNCAWLIEFFAGLCGVDYSRVILRYENNTPNNKEDDIYVSHPMDKEYFPELNAKLNSEGKSVELAIYELKAKASARLKLFEENSPANIEYFQPLS